MKLDRAATDPESPASVLAEGVADPVSQIDDGRRVTEVLREIANTWPDERITLGDFVDLFGDRGHGLLMLTLALPNLVPVYLPGLSAVTGLPLAAIAVQMALGTRHPWLPGFVLRRSVATADLRKVVERAEPWLRPVERVLQPRLSPLAHGLPKRLMGVVCVALALLLSLPIPLTNIPLAAPIVIFSLGVVERDGAAVAVAAIASVAAVAFVGTAAWALVGTALAFLGL
jgi:hypothetical protein